MAKMLYPCLVPVKSGCFRRLRHHFPSIDSFLFKIKVFTQNIIGKDWMVGVLG
jgi:hypothetical protein